jgi:hypothetical protein
MQVLGELGFQRKPLRQNLVKYQYQCCVCRVNIVGEGGAGRGRITKIIGLGWGVVAK